MKSHHLTWLLLCVICVFICMETTKSAPTTTETELQFENGTIIAAYTQRAKSFMNTSTDPCDDFYTFACGNYPNVIEDLETFTKRSNFWDGMLTLYDHMDAILTKVRDPNEEYYEELQTTKKFVNTCADAKLFPMQPSEEYLQVLKAIGGFPAIDSTWDASSFDWFNMTAHLTRYGIVGLVEETILLLHPFKPFYKLPKLGFDRFDVSLENIATIESDGYVYNEKIMRNLLQVYNVSGIDADKVIEGIFELWTDILELQKPLLNDEFPRARCWLLVYTYNDNPSGFEKWENLFKIAWDPPISRISIESQCPCDWLYNKLDLLAKEKPEAFANYMALKFLFTMHPKLKSPKFQRRQCIDIVRTSIPMIFTHFYMKEYYNKADEDDISEMILEIQNSWKYLVNKSDWLDGEGRNEALEKLKKLRWRIGQVADPISDIYIKQIKSLRPTDNVALNNLQLARFNVDMRHYGHQHLQNGNTKTAAYGILDVVKIRAFYLRLENSINLMAGLLNPPFYHRDFPNSVKYGSLGYTIGHEIGHGFEGNSLRTTSSFKRKSWLSKESEAIVQQRTSCFVDDYNNYKEPDFHHNFNGKAALSEIEADSMGLRQTFEAYRRVLKDGIKGEGDDFLQKEYLPGLNVNPEQTFFLTFAQLYCSRYEPKNYWAEINSKHPVNRYRVMGTLRNFDEFSNVFNCPLNSPMNPNEKCRVW